MITLPPGASLLSIAGARAVLEQGNLLAISGRAIEGAAWGTVGGGIGRMAGRRAWAYVARHFGPARGRSFQETVFNKIFEGAAGAVVSQPAIQAARYVSSLWLSVIDGATGRSRSENSTSEELLDPGRYRVLSEVYDDDGNVVGYRDTGESFRCPPDCSTENRVRADSSLPVDSD